MNDYDTQAAMEEIHGAACTCPPSIVAGIVKSVVERADELGKGLSDVVREIIRIADKKIADIIKQQPPVQKALSDDELTEIYFLVSDKLRELSRRKFEERGAIILFSKQTDSCDFKYAVRNLDEIERAICFYDGLKRRLNEAIDGDPHYLDD